MIVGTCKNCQTVIYGGVTPGVWLDSGGKNNPVLATYCKKGGITSNQTHEPHLFYTQGDGVVVYDNRYNRYIFVEAPRGWSQLGKGSFMPEDWELQ